MNVNSSMEEIWLSELKWKIQHEHEGSKLDFKKTPYVKENYHELLKDIMSMANVPTNEKRYIVIGVKEHPDSTKEYFSIPKEKIVDQATFQQIVRENIEPTIDFSYYPIELEDNTLGIIEIKNCDDAPYMMKKNYGSSLKKGDCFIRKGSQKEKLTRRDLDEILKFKSNKVFNENILFGFGEGVDLQLTVSGVRNLDLPSKRARRKIESILEEKKNNLEKESKLSHLEKITRSVPRISSPFQSEPYENRSIEQLEENLKNINSTYKDHDWYYVGEEKTQKINFTLINNGNEYLDDVSVEIFIPVESATVMKNIREKPKSQDKYLRASIPNVENLYYPEVEKKSDMYIVRQDVGALKHHQPREVFDCDLRVFFNGENIGKTFSWSYVIYAKNLPNPIKGSLIIEVV